MVLHTFFVLKDQADPQAAKLFDGRMRNSAIQAVIEQYNLMSQSVVLLSHQQIARMRIAVYKAMLVDHITENGN